MVYTFANPKVPTRKRIQYFENNGSRGIYHDGWYAAAFGPLMPWDTAGSAVKLKGWDANRDVWELYDLSGDFSQADDFATREPRRLERMKALFLKEAKADKVRAFLPALAERIVRPMSLIATLLLFSCALLVLFSSWAAVVSLIGNGTIVAIAAFVMVGLLTGHLLGGPAGEDRSVLALATAAHHPGIALAVATANFPEQKLAPAAVLLYLIVMAIVTSLYVMRRRRHGDAGDTIEAAKDP